MTEWSEDLGSAICDLVADGESLRGVCDRLHIARRTIRAWEQRKPAFGAALAIARQHGYAVWADEILTISDEIEGCQDNAQVQAARVRIDARKWLLSKLRPERYGDKVELTGKDGASLIQASPEASIPRLMAVLAILLPNTSNSELHSMASAMIGRLNGSQPSLPASEAEMSHEEN
jgi:hypothetical protein